MNVEEIRHAHPDGGEGLLALVIRSSTGEPFHEGARFVTPEDAYLQVGLLQHPSGRIIGAHVHLPAERRVTATQEVLLIRSGRIRADFYSSRGDYAGSKFLAAGDVLVLLWGGHGIEVLSDAEIVEVKQGPYQGREQDKKAIPTAR